MGRPLSDSLKSWIKYLCPFDSTTLIEVIMYVPKPTEILFESVYIVIIHLRRCPRTLTKNKQGESSKPVTRLSPWFFVSLLFCLPDFLSPCFFASLIFLSLLFCLPYFCLPIGLIFCFPSFLSPLFLSPYFFVSLFFCLPAL